MAESKTRYQECSRCHRFSRRLDTHICVEPFSDNFPSSPERRESALRTLQALEDRGAPVDKILRRLLDMPPASQDDQQRAWYAWDLALMLEDGPEPDSDPFVLALIRAGIEPPADLVSWAEELWPTASGRTEPNLIEETEARLSKTRRGWSGELLDEARANHPDLAAIEVDESLDWSEREAAFNKLEKIAKKRSDGNNQATLVQDIDELPGRARGRASREKEPEERAREFYRQTDRADSRERIRAFLEGRAQTHGFTFDEFVAPRRRGRISADQSPPNLPSMP